MRTEEVGLLRSGCVFTRTSLSLSLHTVPCLENVIVKPVTGYQKPEEINGPYQVVIVW